MLANANLSVTSQPVVLDLFCGAGGMSLGFQMAGYFIALGIDSNPLACQTHAHNFGLQHTLCIDISNLNSPTALLERIRCGTSRCGHRRDHPVRDSAVWDEANSDK